MKRILLVLVTIISFSATAKENTINDPLHSAEEVISALYAQANIKPERVKVTSFEFNYIEGLWHIELAPADWPCLDCYPSYYFRNKQKLLLEHVPHG